MFSIFMMNAQGDMIKKQIVFFLVYLFILNLTQAQQIVPTPQNLPAGELYFNPAFIKEHKIKSLTGYIADKKDGESIIDRGLSIRYTFDSLGRVSSLYKTFIISKKEIEKKKSTEIIYVYDTTFYFLYHDSTNKLLVIRNYDLKQFNSKYYDYYPDGSLKKEMRCRETNVGTNIYDFKLGIQEKISNETYSHQKLTDKQVKKKYLNDEGTVYKECITDFNQKGEPVKEFCYFTVSWMRMETNYQYNDTTGKLIKKSLTTNISGEQTERTEFIYLLNNLDTEKRYKNNTLLFEISYLYDEQKQLLKTLVTRDHIRSSIVITKFNYEFY